MKEIKLTDIVIRNFKGFKEFKLEAEGNDLKVYGDNATGKTTIFDAFSWVLFGKDSNDSASFAWKPLDKNNNEINHLETEVEIQLDIDGQTLELSRMVKEKWTRKRGSNSESFEGHESEYRIDGIKTTLTKYKKKIEEVISEDTFKQLTNVYYVAETMKVKDRRSLLFSLVEEVTDQEVIDSKKELKPLEAILDGRSVDDKRQLITEERRNVKRDLDRIPDRIDEVDRSMPDLTLLDQDELNKEVEKVNKAINEKESDISSYSNGDQLSNFRAELKSKEAELKTARSEYRLHQNDSIGDLQDEKQEVKNRLSVANDNLATEHIENGRIEYDIKVHEKKIESLNVSISELRDHYKKVAAKTYPDFDEHKKTCALCGQDYPEDQQEQMINNYEKERAQFNQEKAEKLENINDEGRKYKEKIEQAKEDLEEKWKLITVNTKFKELEVVSSDVKKELDEIDKQIADIREQRIPFEQSEDYIRITKEIESLEQELSDFQKGNREKTAEMESELDNLKEEKEKLQNQLYQFKLVEKQEARRNELIDDEKKLASRYGELDNQLFLLDEFVRTKVSLLTSKINDQFNLVTFKLFEEQINGGLKEVCEPLVDGVPFSSGLNSAARINAGLDIINTLSRLEGVSAPIFVDNSESITALIETDAQTIQLIVTEGQDKLKIETKGAA